MTNSQENAIVFGLAGLSLVLSWMLGVFRGRSVVGPPRLDRDERVTPLWLVLFIGLGAMVVVPSAYASIRGAREFNSATTQPGFSDREKASLAAAGAIGMIVALGVGTELLRPGGLERLGLSVRSLPRGVAAGLISTAIVMPLMIVASMLTKEMWDFVGREHPDAHQLLRIMRADSDPSLRRLIIVSAAVLAPVAEELLFRGHLQTAILHSLDRRGDRAGTRWGAIVLASFIFTMFHQELWLMPPIFVLSVCLGYLYERTGNLWACIFLHAAFNGVNIAMFSMQAQR